METFLIFQFYNRQKVRKKSGTLIINLTRIRLLILLWKIWRLSTIKFQTIRYIVLFHKTKKHKTILQKKNLQDPILNSLHSVNGLKETNFGFGFTTDAQP